MDEVKADVCAAGFVQHMEVATADAFGVDVELGELEPAPPKPGA